jgi:Glycine rich protein
VRLAHALAAALAGLCIWAAPAAADTVVFNYTGGEQTFTVPAGNSSIQVTAIGASGENGGLSLTTSGRGARVSGTLAVTPGQILYVEVGGVGTEWFGDGSTPGGGGFNGGGDTYLSGSNPSGGGGASDVRTRPRSDGPQSLSSRLLVAGGGGGRGDRLLSGGDAGSAGEIAGCGGEPGKQNAGGAPGEEGAATTFPTAGSSGQGGTGGKSGTAYVGGGGGGGYFGGGGGNVESEGDPEGCGGGGGSSLVPSGGTSSLADRTTPPQVEITFTAPPAGGGGPAGGVIPSDGTRPVLRDLAMSPSSFTAAKTGPGFITAVGTRVSYRLSEAASTRFTVERATRGRRRGRRCVKGRRGRRCTRYVRVRGSFNYAGAAGVNRLRFRGRMAGRKLRRGRYRLVAVATDAAGNRSRPVRRAFRIR